MDVSYVLAGGFVGFVVGLTGVGGGALMTPLLVLFFGVPPMTAVGTDLWFAVATKLVGARVHHAHGQVDWQVATRLWWGSLPMALLVVALLSMGVEVVKVSWLSEAIGLVLALTALGMVLAPRLLNHARTRRLRLPESFKAMQPPMTVFFGAVLGLCVALTSVGAGALGSLVLVCLYPLRMTPARLVATDIVHAVPLAAVAGVGYLFLGRVDGWMLANLLVGSVPAVVLGSLLAGRLNGRWLQLCLACVLLLSVVKVLSEVLL
jgi:uncharacterized membrane protein YfcA